MNSALLISSFILGIGGSLHCLGMCGPLALSVPYNTGGYAKWLRTGSFNLSKALAYGSMGALSGLFGKGFFLMNWQQGLSIAAGIFILLWASFPVLKPGAGNYLFRKQFGLLYQKMQAQPKMHHYILLGFMNGFLPCGLVYTALAAATVSGGAWNGFLCMFAFGIGTAPALMILVLIRNKISFRLRQKLRPVSLVLSISIGLLLIIRGLNLGIPYVSPEVSGQQVKSCCSKH